MIIWCMIQVIINPILTHVVVILLDSVSLEGLQLLLSQWLLLHHVTQLVLELEQVVLKDVVALA